LLLSKLIVEQDRLKAVAKMIWLDSKPKNATSKTKSHKLADSN